MKYLIVNGDDFGGSPGINRGMIEAHRWGILTSASLLVNTPWSEEAAKLGADMPWLSIGLHVDLQRELNGTSPDGPALLRDALRSQLARFVDLVDRLPTHIDSHHNVHRDPRALPYFLELAAEHKLPLRGHSPVRYFASFYGQWNGDSHPEQIGAESLMRMFETEIGGGVTELSCHPGFVGAELTSGYAAEREIELHTLCELEVRRALVGCSIQLVSYHDLGQLAATDAA